VKVSVLIFTVACFVLFMIGSCVNETEPEKEAETKIDYSCAGDICENDSDCKCTASFCMPEEIRNMPNVGEINAGRCTVINCNIDKNDSCPDNYDCWALTMGKQFFPENTESVCMKKASAEEEDDDSGENDEDVANDPDEDPEVNDEDDFVDDSQDITDDDLVDEENDEDDLDIDEDQDQDIFPSCYGDPCKSSSECCEGTSCLPKMAEMDPAINESEYCAIKDCDVNDQSTCPENYNCVSSMMGSYCVKQ
jgi:hypothetical protein